MVTPYIRELFLETVRDLGARSVPTATPYETLRAALLVRQLFKDGQSLVDAVNRHYREEILFDVIATGEAPPVPDIIMITTLLPGWVEPNAKHRRSLSRKEFFRLPIGRIEEERLTIHELLEYIAYSSGGIHLQKMTHPQEIMAFVDENFLQHMGFHANLIMFRNVAAICHQALGPLVERVK